MKRKTYVFEDNAGQWRWHIKSANGNVIADSAESYHRLNHTIKMAKSFGYPTYLKSGKKSKLL